MTPQELQAMIEAARKKLALKPPTIVAESITQTIKEVVKQHTQFDTSASDWAWNEEQLDGIAKARKRDSFNLIGAAGTGKTTTTKEIVRILIAENLVPMLSMDTKYLQKGKPGIVLTSFTRRAVRNLRRAVSADVQMHCVTLHKLLEYEPQFYEVWDESTQKMRNTMRFEPARNRNNRLPSTLKTIIIDESSMVSVDLFLKLLEALPDPKAVQFIFIGDLHQLPPVYGQAILGFKLLELKTVELTKIYRQAAKSPIISLAHRIKNGEDIENVKNETIKNEQGMVTIHNWKKPLSDFDAMRAAGFFLRDLITKGDYDEEEDIILCPQEKTKNLAFGTNEFNNVVAQTLGDKRSAVVFEIVSGYEKHYYAVGDRLLVGREDAIITNITRNAKFFGKRPRPASKDLCRDGSYRKAVTETVADDDMDVDAILESFTLVTDKDEDRKQEASHIVEVELLDSGIKEVISTAGEINATQFAYCLTVHKSQGSEWSRVFFLTHQSHVVMWSRELLYTAITRARNSLYLIIEPDRPGRRGTLWKAAKSPRIKGDTLAEKAEYFKGKKDDYDNKVKNTEGLPWQEGTKGQFKGETRKEAPRIEAPYVPPVPLIKLAEFVSAAFKEQALRSLTAFWRKAESIYGADRIGPIPMMDYDLQRSKTVGLAQLQSHHIKLNPLWCILADDNEKIKHEMLVETIGHEVAHLVAWKYSNDRGHNSGWSMTMQLLGLKPDVYVQEGVLPTWAEGYKEVAIKKLAELKAQKNADTADETPTIKDYNEEV